MPPKPRQRRGLTFTLSPGQAHDAPEGRNLAEHGEACGHAGAGGGSCAYEDDGTRQLVLNLGFVPVVPPRGNRLSPWEYDREMYRQRNEVERLFRRLKGFRRIFSRFEKLEAIFLGFLIFVLIVDALQ